MVDIINIGIGTNVLNGKTTNPSSNSLNNMAEFNIAIGHLTANSIETGDYNLGIGPYVMKNLSSGSKNVILGYLSGVQIVSGNNNIILGSDLENPFNQNGSNQINIGNQIFGNDGKIAIGNIYKPTYDNGLDHINYIGGKVPIETLEVDGNIYTTQGLVLKEGTTSGVAEGGSCSKKGQIVFVNDSFFWL